MELTQLQALIDLLRAAGVTKYEAAGIKLELGPTPQPPARIDLNREGFTNAPAGRDPALQNILNRLDPAYSDPALFHIG